MAAALHYMAAEGWVHLDLKPDNIVMGLPPRIIDLSLARTVAQAALVRDHIGTNAYMPPEQCLPDGDIGPAADVWGLGATLYAAVDRPAAVPQAGRRVNPTATPSCASRSSPRSRGPGRCRCLATSPS